MFEILGLTQENNLNFKDEDFKFVNLCKEGDIESFEILVKKHQKNIINFGFRILQNFDDACDIAQEVFLQAYKKIKTFKAESKFSTWLYKITLNLSRNHLRKFKREKHGKKYQINEIEKSYEIASDDPLPLVQMEKEELKEKVYKTLSLMDQEYKEIIILRDMECLSYEEIGYLLKIPQGTVKSRLSRARQNFIEVFEKLRRK